MPILGISENRPGTATSPSSATTPATPPVSTPTGGNSQILDDTIPDDIPTVPSSKLNGKTRDRSSITLNYQTLETADTLIKYFASELPAKGWNARLTSSNQGSDLTYQSANFIALKPDKKCEINIYTGDQQTTVHISYQMPNQW